jgi:hypothetical protein
MGRREEAKAEFAQTRILNKAADQSVFTKIDEARAQNKPAETKSAAPQPPEQPVQQVASQAAAYKIRLTHRWAPPGYWKPISEIRTL